MAMEALENLRAREARAAMEGADAPELLPVAVVGSREFLCLSRVESLVASFGPGTKVVTGDARGVDARAILAAQRRGLAIEVHRADWQAFGKRAGVMRNTDIIRASKWVFVFLAHGGSKGAQDDIDKAEKFRRRLVVVDEDVVCPYSGQLELGEVPGQVEAWGAGVRVRDEGLPRDIVLASPYARTPELRCAWRRGWDDCDAAMTVRRDDWKGLTK